jgi:hypothetical protein
MYLILGKPCNEKGVGLVSSDTDIHSPNQRIPGMAYEGLMKIIRVNGRKVDSKWAPMDIVWIHVRGLRLQTYLKLPSGCQVVWEFQVNEGSDQILNVRGIVLDQCRTRFEPFEGKYLYEARFIMDELHPLMIQRHESYSGCRREKKAREGQKLDLLG